jgi:16S rRNA (uracil1498-N3)-methyltransferase
MRANYRMQRLFLDLPLVMGGTLTVDGPQAHYLATVLRMKVSDAVLVFNGRDGEWRAEIAELRKKALTLVPVEQTRPQPPALDFIFAFAPIKAGRLDYLVQKAVEMGAGTIQPVITQHTQMTRIGTDRLQANALEAAEQCGILALPKVEDAIGFDAFLARWDAGRRLIFCDEAEASQNPLPILAQITDQRLGVVIGPEGGFSDAERKQLRALPFVTAIPLGPRILRADTAAVAAMAVIQAAIGDWG